MLKRWEGELWKVIPQRKNDSDVWIPVELRRRYTRQNQDEARIANLAHELAIADVYCALFPHSYEDGSRVLEFWERSLQNDTYTATRYDASLILYGQPFFLEVERGNHPILSVEQANKAKPEYYRDTLNFKFDRYVDYFHKNDYKPFTVLVTVEHCKAGFYEANATKELIQAVKDLAERYRPAPHKQSINFLIASHRDVVGDKDATAGEIHNEVMGDPLGEVWYHPAQGGYISLRDV